MTRIDSGIPIPPTSRGRPSPWPWRELEIGDSFLMVDRNVVQAGSMACKARDRTGRQFTCRTEGENVRVWRVS